MSYIHAIVWLWSEMWIVYKDLFLSIILPFPRALWDSKILGASRINHQDLYVFDLETSNGTLLPALQGICFNRLWPFAMQVPFGGLEIARCPRRPGWGFVWSPVQSRRPSTMSPGLQASQKTRHQPRTLWNGSQLHLWSQINSTSLTNIISVCSHCSSNQDIAATVITAAVAAVPTARQCCGYPHVTPCPYKSPTMWPDASRPRSLGCTRHFTRKGTFRTWRSTL